MPEETQAPLILVVEDEPLIAELFEVALEDAGFVVPVFQSAEGALSWLDRRDVQFAGVVTDINLGGSYRGWEIAARAREVSPNAAIVYCTGFDAADWASKGVPESVVLTKPFVPAQLVVALANQLNGTALRDRA